MTINSESPVPCHDNIKPENGLTYTQEFLDSLPILDLSTLSCSSPSHTPALPLKSSSTENGQPATLPYTIRALTAAQFASLHTKFMTTHAPDSAIFPFLHGLEGENDQQNAFFATAARIQAQAQQDQEASACYPRGEAKELGGAKLAVPKFRGLVWVASDEDEVEEYERALRSRHASHPHTHSSHPHPHEHITSDVGSDMSCNSSSDFEDDDDDYSTSASSMDEHDHDDLGIDADGFVGMPMDVDSDLDLELNQHARGLEDDYLRGPVISGIDGISLRNFGIQVPIFATLSDIVVYSPRGNTKAALAVASHFAHAVDAKRAQRAARGQTDLLHYNVFVLEARPEEMVREMPNVVARMADEVVGSGAHTTGTDAATHSDTHPADTHAPTQPKSRCELRRANTISFAQREKDEMRDLTQATEILTFPVEDDQTEEEFSATTTAAKWDPKRGQVFLGNASDVPLPPPSSSVGGRRGYRRASVDIVDGRPQADSTSNDEWDWSMNDPALGLGYDICIECDDMAPFPSQAHMRAAEEHISKLDKRWAEKCAREMEASGVADPATEIPVRPPPPANAVIHLPFPSSVAYASNSVLPFVTWLETLLKPTDASVTVGSVRERNEMENRKNVGSNGRSQARRSTNAATIGHSAHGFGGPSSLPPPSSFPTSFLPQNGSSDLPSSSSVPITSSANLYTRMRSTSATHLTSPPASSTPSNLRTRPLKILIYSSDGYTESSSLALCIIMALRKLSLPEAYLELQNEKRRSFFVYPNELTPMKRIEARLERDRSSVPGTTKHGRPAATSVSFAQGPAQCGFLASSGMGTTEHPLSSSVPKDTMPEMIKRRRATTLPQLSTPSDHQIWFNDPRFDGSFPSRVLPFLYLGNLNHAANAYMLHALGITHVVSVGECALIPPENGSGSYTTGFQTAKPGSLWIEEREGRIKVLDIKGVCDDGIDSLEPQLPPICEWIDQARQEGGKVLVHCRVGVSRSATVTIAYVMQHLGIPLVDAYLIVRSRRLSVLIQPNMRLLYNLLGWEIKLAQERAGDDEQKLRAELARCLNWPYLAKEVHTLNEKYLH
ncbi:hypothetical protein EW026_g5436 [Hermanssonia centrifuga]|uniref:Uncharacterized protein n=1 Tax=Hermanssonia centrifuga TaxID=98765 RepID=A0A4S4KEC9_9APHY|nr:hypothetical protein EW026_g5436 [Hermanssonia centrifuga]